MTVHLYTISWNEADMLGFFFRHYDPWVDRYVIYDDGSTDGTLEQLRAHPKVEVRRFERSDPSSFVRSHTDLQDNVWKESRGRADWAVITAIDEHLHVSGMAMREYLEESARLGVTCIPGLGFQMISRTMAEPGETLCLSRTMGVPFQPMSKLSLFNPNAVAETNYKVGRHKAKPAGRIRLPRRDRLLVLHYKNLGYERTLKRECFLKTGLGPGDIEKNWGWHYHRSEPEFRKVWEEFESRVEDISRPGYRPWRDHREERHWRPAWWRRLRRWGVI